MNYELTHPAPDLAMLRIHNIPDIPVNAYVFSGPKSNFVIDSGFGSGSAAEITKLLDPVKPTWLILTHHHWDHVWGSSFIPGARIVCSERCAALMRSKWDDMKKWCGQYLHGEATLPEPDILFDSRLVLDGEVEIFPAPGHSDDCVAVYVPSKGYLFVGDDFGDNDGSLLPEMEKGKETELRSTLAAFEARSPRLFLSGHNVPKGPDIIAEMRKLLASRG